MGQIADVVPNHIGIMGADGRWWLSVLEHGQASRFADYFDIDWRPVTPKLKDKVLVPVLGDQYGNVLLAGDLVLHLDERGAKSVCATSSIGFRSTRRRTRASSIQATTRFRLAAARSARRPSRSRALCARYRLFRPIAQPARRSARRGTTRPSWRRGGSRKLAARSPGVAEHLRRSVAALNGVAGDRSSYERLHELLERQAYRLAYWRVAADEINYRRFFDINDLAALRTPEHGRASRRRTANCSNGRPRAGSTAGASTILTGLYDPRGYLEWVRARLAEIGRPELYIVVEKILASHEHLPRGWPVQGTTGYDFANVVNGVFVFGPAERDFDRVYRGFTGERESFESMLHECKQQILAFHLSSELTLLANLLYRLAESRLETRDFTLNEIRAVLLELVSAFPVYRSYVTPEHVGRQDLRHIEWAVEKARESYGNRDDGLLDFVRGLLLGQTADDADAGYRARAAELAAQVSAGHRARDGEGARGHGLLPLRAAALAERRRLGSAPLWEHAGGVPPAKRAAPRHWPHSMLGDVDARQQAQRGRARAAQCALGDPLRLGGSDREVAALQPREAGARRRTARAVEAGGVPALSDARRLVARRRSRSRVPRVPHAHIGLHDQGAARGEGQHVLGKAERAVRRAREHIRARGSERRPAQSVPRRSRRVRRVDRIAGISE